MHALSLYAETEIHLQDTVAHNIVILSLGAVCFFTTVIM